MIMAAIMESAHQWASTGLMWIGFGTVVGLLAKGIMPGRDEGGTVITLLVGIGGTVVGLGVLAFFGGGQQVTPLSFVGFLAAIGGAFVLLFFHRLLQGSLPWKLPGAKPAANQPHPPKRPYQRRGATVVVREE